MKGNNMQNEIMPTRDVKFIEVPIGLGKWIRLQVQSEKVMMGERHYLVAANPHDREVRNGYIPAWLCRRSDDQVTSQKDAPYATEAGSTQYAT
jgi:hypothetical protein